MAADRVLPGRSGGLRRDFDVLQMSRLVRPPCTKDCPRRRVQPNCHNREYCPEWGKFLDAEADWKAKKEEIVKKENDTDKYMKACFRRLAIRAGKDG